MPDPIQNPANGNPGYQQPVPMLAPQTPSSPGVPLSTAQPVVAGSVGPQPQQPAPSPTGYEPPQPAFQMPAASVSPIRDQLTKRGFDVSGFQSDDDILMAMEQGLPQLQQLPELQRRAQMGDYYLQHADDIERFRAQQQSQQVAADPEPEQPLWNPPQINQQFYELCDIDENTGRYRPKTPELMQYAQKLNDYHDYLRTHMQAFQQNPYEFVMKGVEPQFKTHLSPIEKRLQALEQQLIERQTEEFIAGVQSDYIGADGKTLTPKGNAFEAAFQNAPKDYSHAERLAFARDQADLWAFRNGQQAPQAAAPPVAAQSQQQVQSPSMYQQAQPAQSLPAIPQTAEQRNQIQKDTFLNRHNLSSITHNPNRDTSVAVAAANEIGLNPDASFAEMAAETAKQMGVPLTTSV